MSFNYSNTTNGRDIVLYYQKDSAPWTFYGTQRIRVDAGTGSRTISIRAAANTPVAANGYQVQVFLATRGGEWAQRIANQVRKDIDGTASGTRREVFTSDAAAGTTNYSTSSSDFSENDVSSDANLPGNNRRNSTLSNNKLPASDAISVFPNPLGDGDLTVRVPGSQQMHVDVYAADGRQVGTFDGLEQLRLPATIFSSGIYYLRVVTEDSEQTRRIIVR